MHVLIRWLVVALLVAAPGSALAEPEVGITLRVGESLGGEADWRVASNLYVRQALPSGVAIGGELAGSFEAYTGGYGCADFTGDVAVPAIAVSCLQPSVAAHVIVGYATSPGARFRVRGEAAVGAALVYLVPGQGGHTRRDTEFSTAVRTAVLARVGQTPKNRYWLGVQLEQRALGVRDAYGSFGLVFEVRDVAR